mgnify:CR=1 FL=1
MNERRSVPRVAPEKPLKAKVHASFPVRVLDISERGAQIEVERSLRPNVGCELRFPSPDGEFVMRATVRRCRAWGFVLSEADQRVLVFRAGVEFDRPDPELLRRLRLAATEAAPGPASSSALGDALSREAGLPGETMAPAAEVPATAPGGEPLPAPPLAATTPPRGPVKIRIRSDHVRRILLS